MRVVLAVAHQEVGAQHVHRGVRERHVGGERRAPRQEHRREGEQVGEQRQREQAAQLAQAPRQRARAAAAHREPARGERHDEKRRGRGKRVGVGAQLCQRDQRGRAQAGSSGAGSPPALQRSTSSPAPAQSTASTHG